MLSEERRQQIEQAVEWARHASANGAASILADAVADLLAEVDRLTARVDFMHEIDERRMEVIRGHEARLDELSEPGALIDRLRAEVAGLTEENQRLRREIDEQADKLIDLARRWRAGKVGATAIYQNLKALAAAPQELGTPEANDV